VIPFWNDYSGSGVVSRCLGVDNKETNGEFWRSRTACSLESSNNLITCRGDHRVRMIYHSHSLLLTAAADLAVAIFDRSCPTKSRSSPGSFRRTKAILRCKSILTRIDILAIHKILPRTIIFPLTNQKLQLRHIRRSRQPASGIVAACAKTPKRCWIQSQRIRCLDCRSDQIIRLRSPDHRSRP